MQTLRKKTSPLKYKNETSRFLGEGVSFKAKLIGILEVSEARGDRMCQEALSDLKTAIRAAGEHKQRITINIAIDGLRLRDEKTGDSLYHHPVHKISFIAQDMTDSRAFGYIFGSPDTGHRFFGIKTDKAASQVVIAMRDLFQVVFALKKKEIELAKQHLDKNRYGSSPPLFSESSLSSSKLTNSMQESSKTVNTENKSSVSNNDKPTPAVADLVDLELELNSLQQGLNQMERITPSDPFGSKDDPFGDSFTPFPKPILPPPPSSGKERSSRSSDSSSLFSPKTPLTVTTVDIPVADASLLPPSKDFSRELNASHDESNNGDWFASSANNNFVEEAAQSADALKDEHEIKKQEILSQFDVFTELDPLDPFGEDPFVKTDPFAEADFPKQDPFETEFEVFNREGKTDQPEGTFKNELQSLFVGSKSPKGSFLEKQMTVVGTSPRTNTFMKQNTFDAFGKMSQLHENPSLDLSSESECAPEPPPRPTSNLSQVKPPPLPPKKQLGEICIKAPPRPPHSDDIHYDYVETYETAPNSLEYIKNLEKSPPLPVPIRKAKFESDFTLPERPKKQYNLSEDEDYLTPIALSKTVTKVPNPILLPPPQKSIKKSASPNLAQVTIASYLESKPNLTTSISREKNTLDGLDITLSQLTVSGLNELASKLNIPTTQLSNMTLVQLTNYLSNFIKNKNEKEIKSVEKFADFANFNNLQSETYDRYAVFRELLQEEIKQTKIDSEPQEIRDENPKIQQEVDKYAALREIVEIEAKENGKHSLEENDVNEDEGNLNEDNEQSDIRIENEANIINSEKFVDHENVNVIEYGIDKKMDVTTPIKSPDKSPPNKVVKSPVPVAITEIMQNNTRLPSGSLSDVVSGSSPEVDNTGSTPEVAKTNLDAAGESWAIFDQPNLSQDTSKDKQNVQSEEGVSPWSSDSKEFGNGSPPDYHPKIDSESGGEHWGRRRNHEGWWDTSAEPEVQYYPANRRSTDSYEDECYDCYDRPRRRRQPGWQTHSGQTTGGHSSSSRDVSPWEEEPNRKRDVRDVGRDQREGRDSRQMWSSHHGQHYFGRNMDRTHTDSWDEEDDYEYEEEHSNRFHWQDRHNIRDSDRDRRSGGNRDHENERWMEDWNDERKQLRRRREVDRERWCCPDWSTGETAPGRYPGTRRYDVPPPNKWRDWKHDERCYNRDSQESPWEDDYSNDPDESRTPHYLTIKRNWKRPSSASETDRKAIEIKPRHAQYHMGTGGSDGERDRRYKTTRRSKSRESQFSDTSHNRHKPDPGLTLRSRSKHHHQKAHFESDFPDMKKIDGTKPDQCKKNSNVTGRKKTKDLKNDEVVAFPRKGTSRAQSLFENDFVSTENDSPLSSGLNQRFYFENDFEASETESPTPVTKSAEKNYEKPKMNLRRFDPECVKEPRKKSSRYPTKQRSLFEDDFSPTEKVDVQENVGISSIKEEASVNDEDDDCSTTNFRASGRKRILSKNRYSYNSNLKKSESINIFARANDPFDDDFFSGKDTGGEITPGGVDEKTSPRTTELKWTEQFEHFDNNDGK